MRLAKAKMEKIPDIERKYLEKELRILLEKTLNFENEVYLISSDNYPI